MSNFNRSYHLRATRGGLVPVGEVLQELVDRAGARQSFYRPAKRTSPVNPSKGSGPRKAVFSKSGKLQGVQLELFPVEQRMCQVEPTPSEPGNLSTCIPDQARPLFDLFPMAYQ